MKKVLLTICAIVIGWGGAAQGQSKFNGGFGIGLDYGGVGARLAVNPIKHFGIFAGAGYNLHSLGVNAGGQFRFNNIKRVVPYLTAMAGYNAVMLVTGIEERKTTYWGPTVGCGVELQTFHNRRTFWNFEFLVPFRMSEYNNDIKEMRNNGYKVNEPLPVAFSVGYHIRF